MVQADIFYLMEWEFRSLTLGNALQHATQLVMHKTSYIPGIYLYKV